MLRTQASAMQELHLLACSADSPPARRAFSFWECCRRRRNPVAQVVRPVAAVVAVMVLLALQVSVLGDTLGMSTAAWFGHGIGPGTARASWDAVFHSPRCMEEKRMLGTSRAISD